MKYLGTFTVRYMDEDREEHFSGESALMNEHRAHTAAQNYVGNRRWSRPFPVEKTYFYGPGDGTVSVMIREDCEFLDTPTKEEGL